MSSRYASAEWLEISGLPAELNKVRAYGWLVFKKIVELDCARHRQPGTVECSLEYLAERCGLPWEKVAAIVLALMKKKYLAAFVPDNNEELGLFEVRCPIKTPVASEDVAGGAREPHLRDHSAYRYLTAPEAKPGDEKKVQKIIDHYLNRLSQKMNSFIVDEIEILARKFSLEKIEKTIERAARHDIRSIHWVTKELIRDASGVKKTKKKKK